MIDPQTINAAQSGQAAALERVARHAQVIVHRLAMRMLADPEAAQDATQDILIRIVTKLSTFRGESGFDTWVYRIATNYLLTARRVRAREAGLTFDLFEDDLMAGLVDEAAAAPEDHVLVNELRIKCTMAMLLCLDPTHRVAYVLGDVLELSHSEAAQVLDLAPATYRQRLSRARARVTDFTARACGLAGAGGGCSCPRRLPAARAMGRIGPAPDRMPPDAPSYDEAQQLAQRTEAALVAARLQQATGTLAPATDLAARVMAIVDPPG